MSKERLLKLKEMEVIAKKATYDALMPYPRPEASDLENLALGTQVTDDEGIFELYVACERPLDAKVITCARVNRRTGEVSIEVFLDKPS